MRLHRIDDPIHFLGGFTNRQAADGVAGQIQFCDPLHVINADVLVSAALVDAPKLLLRVHRIRQAVQTGIFFLAPNQPAIGAIHALENIVPGGRILNTLVKSHTNITAQIGLDLHTLLGAHKDLPAVNMGGEIHAFLLDLPQTGQAEHLKSAGIRQDRTVPGHELMQTAALPDQLVRRPQVQMVGVAQLHLTTDILQILSAESALDGTLGAYIHKDRRLDRAMGAGKFAPASLAFLFQKLIHNYLPFMCRSRNALMAD